LVVALEGPTAEPEHKDVLYDAVTAGLDGVALFDAADADPVPFAFVAVTVNVYPVPFVKPDTTIGDDAPVPVNEPGDDVTVKPVIVEPPLPPAVNVTEAWAFPAVAVPIVGASGTVDGVAELDAADDPLVPYALVAVTDTVYAVPLVSPVITIGDVPFAEPPDPPAAVAV
jgi:hypothetical protein